MHRLPGTLVEEMSGNAPLQIRRRRGGEGRHPWRAEGADELSELKIGGPEALSPLDHAVRLIYHQVGEANLAEGPSQRGAAQGLRVGQNHPELSGPGPTKRPVALLPGTPAGDAPRGDSQLGETALLIGDQCEEGKHHEGKAGQEQRRKLEAEALARPGGKDHDLPGPGVLVLRVLHAPEDAVDHQPLVGKHGGNAHAPGGFGEPVPARRGARGYGGLHKRHALSHRADDSAASGVGMDLIEFRENLSCPPGQAAVG